jgi:hypothetical protein
MNQKTSPDYTSPLLAFRSYRFSPHYSKFIPSLSSLSLRCAVFLLSVHLFGFGCLGIIVAQLSTWAVPISVQQQD